MRSPTSRCVHAGEIELRHWDRCEHLVEDDVGAHLLGERLIREDETMAKSITSERLQILHERVLAAADER